MRTVALGGTGLTLHLEGLPLEKAVVENHEAERSVWFGLRRLAREQS